MSELSQVLNIGIVLEKNLIAAGIQTLEYNKKADIKEVF